jgi:hypothetical protein
MITLTPSADTKQASHDLQNLQFTLQTFLLDVRPESKQMSTETVSNLPISTEPGRSTINKWAGHHCPLGHAWKARCFKKGHCEPCPIHLAKGVMCLRRTSGRRKCPACDAKVKAEERKARKEQAEEDRNGGESSKSN